MFERFFQKAPDETEAQGLMVLLTQSPAMHQLEAEREQARLSTLQELTQRREELKRQHDDAL